VQLRTPGYFSAATYTRLLLNEQNSKSRRLHNSREPIPCETNRRKICSVCPKLYGRGGKSVLKLYGFVLSSFYTPLIISVSLLLPSLFQYASATFRANYVTTNTGRLRLTSTDVMTSARLNTAHKIAERQQGEIGR